MPIRPLLRSGHAPGHIRSAFETLVEDGFIPDESEHRGRPLTGHIVSGLLWNCTDVMPGTVCDLLELPCGSSFATGARRYRRDNEAH